MFLIKFLFCENCGNKIQEGYEFCTHCGTKCIKVSNQLNTATAENENNLTDRIYLEQANSHANSLIFQGIGLAILGFIITGATYAIAEDGGTYTIFYGLVLVGAWQLLKGLFYKFSPQSLVEEMKQEFESEDQKKSKENET